MAASPQQGMPDAPAALPGRSTLHVQLTPMLLIGLIVGVLSTVAVVVTSVIVVNQPPGPPPGTDAPPPPPPHSLVGVIVSCAVFVVAWITVAVAVARDYVVRRLAATAASRTESLASMHDQLAEQMSTLREISEQIETTVFINGMNAAKRTAEPPGDVRPIRTVPNPRD